MDLGRQVKYGIGKETTAGTAVAATNWINQLSFDLNPKTDYATNNSAYGVLERTNSATATRQWAEGEFEAKLTANTGGLILLGAFGSVSTAANPDASLAVKDHTFTINQNINGQSFTLVRKDSLTTLAHPLARFNEWELRMALDDYIRYTATILAKKGVSTTATPAYTAETEFVAKHMSVKIASNVAGLAGATAEAKLQDFTLTVNPNLEADWAAGSNAPYGFSSRGYEIEFEMTCRYSNTTYEDAFNNGTTLALQVTVENTDVTIGTAAKPKLVITAPKMNITDWSREGDLDAPLTQTMTGTIHYSAADAYAVRAVLTNTVASY